MSRGATVADPSWSRRTDGASRRADQRPNGAVSVSAATTAEASHAPTPVGAGLPAGARLLRNVAYGPGAAYKMDIYLPAHPKGTAILFMVHGGAWTVGDKTMARVVANKAAHWLPEGFIFVSTDYRLLPAADPLEQANDVAKALAFAQSQAKSWGGDPSRFVLMGHSAGAHLVTLLAADPHNFG
ncbi:MAG: alpha/beta hydrolase [Acidobacteriia bacterium]|nr:alpha/beta hydrolase [Terriglobia bacterium]